MKGERTLTRGSKPIRLDCPRCEKERSAVFTDRVSLRFTCHSCGFTGEGSDIAAKVKGILDKAMGAREGS